MIHFISDTHFGHSNIIKYSQRPYIDVVEMNKALIRSWNKVVSPQDDVWHLGDVAFMQKQPFFELLNSLNGYIHIVLGNHDKLITHNRSELIDTGKIVSIQNYAEFNINGHFLVLNHYAQRVWNKSHHGSIHLYGHSHGSLPPFGLSVDVGVDSKEITPEYRPVSLNEVIQYMNDRKIKITDHHGER